MNKKHRIFISIAVPGDVKKYFSKYQQQLPDLPATWTPPDNMHITLVFLGDLTDEEMGEVCMIAKAVAADHEGFEVTLTGIGYGPDEKLPPRFIWAMGEKSAGLSALKRDLEDAFLEKINFKPDIRISAPHITLARISTFAWRQIEPEERPAVAKEMSMTFLVESIDVMESELKKGGPQYTLIETLELKE